jgi:iron complex transport system permease protein
MMENARKIKSRLWRHLAVAGSCALVLALVIPFIGGDLDVRQALSARPWQAATSPAATIFWQTRIPRVLAALGCGAALAMAGVVFQAALRNPLAEPYILGVSGGAALGKALVVLAATGGSTGALLGLTNLGAFLGALAPIFVLHLVGRWRRRWSSTTILLAGVVMNVFASALLLLIQYFSDFTIVRQMFAWMLGGVDIVGYAPLAVVWPTVAVGAVLLTWCGRSLNVVTLGTVTATHLGVDVRRLMTLVLWIAALLTAVSVAVAGPIGFVGLIVPHIVRSLVSSDHRLLLPLSAVYGGITLLVCDFLGWRGLELLQRAGIATGQSSEIPVGIITACIGGPFFLWVLFRDQRSVEE